MSSILSSALVESLHHAIQSTQHFADRATRSSGVVRIRQHFIDASAPETTDPIKILKRARHEAHFLHNQMVERSKQEPDCIELQAYATLCGALNAIPSCSLNA